MKDIDNSLRSIDGLVSRIKKELLSKIDNAKSIEEVIRVVEFVKEKIAKNPNISQIVNDIYNKADKKVAFFNKLSNRKK